LYIRNIYIMRTSLLYRSQNFTQSDIEDIVNFIDSLNESTLNTRKISFLTVEILQNIIHHSDSDKNGATYAYFELLKEDNTYVIKSGNLITKENSKSLEENLKNLTSLSEEDIRSQIKEKLSEEGFTEKGGAGIGLLSIHKRTNKGLDYTLEYFEGDYNFIHFELVISL